MALRDLLAGRPLFIRIFALMLAGVLLAQGLNFLMLLAVPMPPPTLYRLADVAESLRKGIAIAGLDVSHSNRPPPNAGPPDRLRADRRWLVDALGIDQNLVRLELRGPNDMGGRGPGFRELFGGHRSRPDGPPKRPPGDRPPPPGNQDGDGPGCPLDNDDTIMGDFAAAMKQPGGEWRIVQPAGGGLRGWYQRMAFWLLAALGVVVPLAWWLARWLAGPIAMFARAAERLGRDPGAPALDVTGPPEVRAAASAFNQMQDRLRRYVEDRTLMVAAIAHDLRTPLARLAFRLEDAPNAVRDAAADDIAEMREMIAAALSFVKDMSRPVTRDKINLQALVARQILSCQQMGESVRDGALEPAIIDGDPASIARLVDNVIGNATIYGGSALVSLSVDGTHAIIQVDDEGPGIPDALLERVFEPFFRVEPSRNRHTGGTGLGLASARAVARQHGGDVTLCNRPTGGLCARIMLPLRGSLSAGHPP